MYSTAPSDRPALRARVDQKRRSGQAPTVVRRRRPTILRRLTARLIVLPVACTLMLHPAVAPAHPGTSHGDTLTLTVPVQAGWNIISLPVRPEQNAKDSVFDASVSSAFGYDDGYHAADTLSNGAGYWLKFSADGPVPVTGTGDFRRTIPLRAGWNLVGGISTIVAAQKIASVPPGIIASRFFHFDPDSGYRSSDTLRPGAGYWVKSALAGSLVLTSLDVPCPGAPAGFDYENYTYHPVQIADQCWLRENLNAGNLVLSIFEHQDNGVVEKYCWNDDSNSCRMYGALYQWNEAMNWSAAPGGRGICPEGWHIPTLAEFSMLDTITHGDGNQLKALRQGQDDGVGTNVTGFSALLTPYRQLDWFFSLFGYHTYFWTSTTQGTSLVSALYLFYNYNTIYFYNLDRNYGLGVRCLKD